MEKTYRSSSTTKAHNGGKSSTTLGTTVRLGIKGISDPLLDVSPVVVDQSLSLRISFACVAFKVCWSICSKEESFEDPESGGG